LLISRFWTGYWLHVNIVLEQRFLWKTCLFLKVMYLNSLSCFTFRAQITQYLPKPKDKHSFWSVNSPPLKIQILQKIPHILAR